jgi:hypothetical protein
VCDRDRERVEDDERADEQRDDPNASRKYWMNFVNSAMSFALAFACSDPV